ncbi:MAG: hypothetical protein E6Q50_01255 [Lysobacter sp.]|nr:MAG: hypothetical protein E6Q50_01255 [Lysobacter sp.]
MEATEDERLLLRLRLALRVPQFRADKISNTIAIGKLAAELLKDIRNSQAPYLDRIPVEAKAVISDDDFQLEPLLADDARICHTAFHYIGAHRIGRHYGLSLRASRQAFLPYYSLTFSEFDIESADPFIREWLSGLSLRVLSRAHAFRCAPYNAFSFSLSRAIRNLSENEADVDALITYVNPNVGFTGATYRATGWVPLAEEAAKYYYLNEKYITVRELSKFGLFSSKDLARGLQISGAELLPLRIYALPVSKRSRIHFHRRGLHGKQDN